MEISQRSYAIIFSVLWAIVGAMIVNILPYINLTDLKKSEMPPFKSSVAYRFSFIFLFILGGIVDLLYCLDGETIPKSINSLLTGASAPSILATLLKSIATKPNTSRSKNNDKNNNVG